MNDIVEQEVEDTLETTDENVEEVDEKSTELTNEEQEVEETEEDSEEEISEIEEEHAEPKEELIYSKSKTESIVKDRLRRERTKYNQLLDVLHAGGFEGNTVEELTKEVRNVFEEQGIEVPSVHSYDGFSEKEVQALAKIDAEEVIELGQEAMEERYVELYNKQDRTAREEAEMELIVREAAVINIKGQFVEMGLNPDEMMNDKKFIDFASQFNPDVPMKKVYKLYAQSNGSSPEKPKSTGSVKSKGTSNKVKDFYTKEEALKFTEEDYDRNPKLLEVVENSMTKW